MAKKDHPPADSSAPGEPEDKPERSLTLEQALLAPLDSILKAQLHSARSFLNMLLQLGYPHDSRSDNPDKAAGAGDDHPGPSEPYHMEFAFRDEDDEKQVLKVPALSLVPIAPLAVDSASFELEMAAEQVVERTQLRSSEKSHLGDHEAKFNDRKRPWFLVDNPVDIRGEIIAPTQTDQASKKQTQSAIKINIQVKSVPMPAGLSKLLTTLTNISEVEEFPRNKPDSETG